jgi:hypothetical protein
MPTSTMKTRSGNKKGPSGESMPRRSKRASPPSTPDPRAGTTVTRSTKGKNLGVSKRTATPRKKGKKLELGKKNRTKLVTPDGKSQTPLAKRRCRFGSDIGVQSEEDSETKVANEARMPSAKTGANDNVNDSGQASKNKKIKMFAGYKSTNRVLDDNRDEMPLQNVAELSARQRQDILRQFQEDDDSIPDSAFPDWV